MIKISCPKVLFFGEIRRNIPYLTSKAPSLHWLKHEDNGRTLFKPPFFLEDNGVKNKKKDFIQCSLIMFLPVRMNELTIDKSFVKKRLKNFSTVT